MTQAIYMDYNATAPLRPEARTAVLAALDQVGNPSSVHAFGRRARRVVEEARAAVAALAGVTPAEVVFTGGATEANATVLAGTGRARRIVSAIEHESVLAAAPAQRVPVTADGVIDLAALDRLLAADPAPALVSLMAVNNETGAIQPVAEAAALARRHGALVHCDAVQAAGRIPIEAAAWDVDFLGLSAHKIGGPQGVGALIVRGGASLGRLLKGGGQERRRRAGTENVAGIAGFGAAARAALDGLSDRARLGAWRDRLERRVKDICADAVVFAAGAPRVANTSCLTMPGVPAETQLMGFDLAGVAVSAGAACSSGKVATSHVLLAMGAGEDDAASAVRVSLGWASAESDVDRFVAAWQALYARAGTGRALAAAG